MRKSITTIEGLDKKFDEKFDQFDKKFDRIDQQFNQFGQILEHIQGSIEVLVKKVAENTSAIDDNTSSIQFLIGNVLMRDEVQPILSREITQSESRMISHMERFIRRHITVEEEVLIHGHKIGVIEQTLGLLNVA